MGNTNRQDPRFRQTWLAHNDGYVSTVQHLHLLACRPTEEGEKVMAERKTFQTFDEAWAKLKEKYPEVIAEAEKIKEEMEKEEETKKETKE